MASARLRFLNGKWLQRRNSSVMCYRIQKILFCSQETIKDKPEKELKGFAASFIKQTRLTESLLKQPESFAALLRHSKFIDLGDPEGKTVVGTIYHVMDEDLYIDFGWKFPTVCQTPKKDKHLYVPGAKVKLLVKDLELSARFLGGTTDITLLEADCVLLGLYKSEVL